MTQYSFGGAPRFKVGADESPGPAQYTPTMKPGLAGTGTASIIGNSPRQGIGGKPNPYIPGPGTYSIDQKAKRAGKTMGGKASKEYSNISPGPAAYAPEVPKERRGFGFGGAVRAGAFDKRAVGPGPGQYELKPKLNPRACTMTPRREALFD